MSQPQTAPYGSWKSPITTDLIVAETTGLGQIVLDGDDTYWAESRPSEGGRVVIVGLGAFFYAILNITQTAIMDVADDSVQASTMSAMGFTSLPFVIGSPFLAGYLVDRYGIEAAFIYAAAVGAAATLVMVPIKFRNVRASEPSPPPPE